MLKQLKFFICIFFLVLNYSLQAQETYHKYIVGASLGTATLGADDNLLLFSTTSPNYNYSLSLIQINLNTDDIVLKKAIVASHSPALMSPKNVIYTSTGNILLAFELSTSTLHQPSLGVVIMLDQSGNIIWTKRLGIGYCDERVSSVIEVAPEKYAVLMKYGCAPPETIYNYNKDGIILLDENGDVIDKKQFVFNELFELIEIQALTDGGILAHGSVIFPPYEENEYETILMKLDSSLNVVWAKAYLNYTSNYYYMRSFDNICQDEDGSIICMGHFRTDTSITDSPGKTAIMKLSASGEPLIMKYFDSEAIFNSITRSSSGNYLACGQAGYYDRRGIIASFDTNLETNWVNTYTDTSILSGVYYRLMEYEDDIFVSGNYYLPTGVRRHSLSRINAIGEGDCFNSPFQLIAYDSLALPADTNIMVRDSAIDVTFNEVINYTAIGSNYQFETICSGPASSPEEIESTIKLINPITDKLTIFLENYQHGDLKISITDMAGRKLRTENFTNHTSVVNMDCKDLSEGIYIVTISDGKDLISKKVVKLNATY